MSMASRAILSNFFKEQLTQNHPKYLSGLSRAHFPTTFLEIAVYSTRVLRFSHVFVKLIRYYDWYRLIVDFHCKSQKRDIFLVPVTCYVKHFLKSLFT